MTLDAPPRRFQGESDADYQARVKTALQSPTDFSEALKPRLGGINPTSGPLAQTGNTPPSPTWGLQQAQQVVSGITGKPPPTPGLAATLNAMPIGAPPPMFSGVNDEGLNFQAVLPNAGGSLFTQSISRHGGATYSGPATTRTLTSPYATPGTVGRSWTPFRANQRPRNIAQANGLPF